MAPPTPWRPRTPTKELRRDMPGGDDALFSAVREHAQRGADVRITHRNGASYSIVANGTLWLARPVGGSPIGSFHCVAAAVIAADRYLVETEDAEAQREADFGGDDPKGAA